MEPRPAWVGGEKFIAPGWPRVPLAGWRGEGPPRLRRVGGLRGWSPTLGLRHCPDSYGRLQSRIFRNGGNPDGAMPREGRRPSGREPLSPGTKPMTVPGEEAMANYGPADRLRRRCSSGYPRIPPLHPEFRLPIPHSSAPVPAAAQGLSPCISRRAWHAPCGPFTPSESE